MAPDAAEILLPSLVRLMMFSAVIVIAVIAVIAVISLTIGVQYCNPLMFIYSHEISTATCRKR